jgi:hypothetical protein
VRSPPATVTVGGNPRPANPEHSPNLALTLLRRLGETFRTDGPSSNMRDPSFGTARVEERACVACCQDLHRVGDL